MRQRCARSAATQTNNATPSLSLDSRQGYAAGCDRIRHLGGMPEPAPWLARFAEVWLGAHIKKPHPDSLAEMGGRIGVRNWGRRAAPAKSQVDSTALYRA
jgi:hypothetical protein